MDTNGIDVNFDIQLTKLSNISKDFLVEAS